VSEVPVTEETASEETASASGDAHPFAGVTVIDAAEGVAGGHASRLFADLGARVVKVEPPGGDRLRALGPFAPSRTGDAPDLEAGGLHLALNAGKSSVVLDLDEAGDRERFCALLEGADVLLESAGPGVMERRGLGYGQLRERFPRLVIGSQSPFGLDGPYADRVTSEIVDYAMGGWMYFCGDPEQAPLMVHGHQGELHAGMQLAAGAAAALWHARRTGQGQHVDVATFESLVSSHVFVLSTWRQEGLVKRRGETGAAVIVPCADGHLFATRFTPEIYLLMGEPERVDDPAFQTSEGWLDALPEALERFTEWASTRPKHEVAELAQALRLLVTPVNTVADLAEWPQLEAREFWRSVEHPRTGAMEIPGPPWRFSRSSAGPEAAAPLLDADRAALLDSTSPVERSTPAAAPAQAPRPAQATRLPFEGLRVIEVTNSWAGPLCGMYFADLGAKVVAIERSFTQPTRGQHFAGAQIWPRFYDRGAAWNQFNRNKRAISLDLATEEGRELFLQMVERADVVLENNSARVFPNLGLSYEELAKRNPRIILCSMSGFGSSGPEAHYLGLGSNIEAAAGLIARTGYKPGDFYATSSFQGDPTTGTHAFLGVIAALWERERSGRGQHIDMALAESGAIFAVEPVMDHRLSGRVAEPRGNRSLRIAPQGAYPSAGDDCWLAVACETDEQWSALCTVIGRPELDERHPTVEARRSAHDEIDAAIEAWSEPLDHNEATRRLQAAGVPAGPVLANWELVADPHLFRRDYWVDTVHPEVGFQRWEGLAWHLSETPPPRQARPAARFAEHNDEVLRELGVTDEQLATLRESAVIADVPAQLRIFSRPTPR
jgi:crotonobetainyl-CoA:carnitine CoA-transferase CaiB-like acyl-CoA transferase